METQAKTRARETYPGSHLENAQQRRLWLRIVMIFRVSEKANDPAPGRDRVKDRVLSVQACL